MKKKKWLVELTEQEKLNLNGGFAWGVFWGAVAWSIFENFGDIREGISDGLNGKAPRY